MTTPLTDPQAFAIFEDNLNPEEPPVSSTGSYWSNSIHNNVWQPSRESLDRGTPSPVVQPLLTNTFGKKRPELQERSSSLVKSQYEEIVVRIGQPLNNWQRVDGWMTSQTSFLLSITGHSEQLAQTIRNQLVQFAGWSYTGVRLESGSLEGPGSLPELTLTQKIRTQNFGTAIERTKMLLLMNSEGLLTSRTCSDGSTDIRCLWKLRDPQLSFVQRLYM